MRTKFTSVILITNIKMKYWLMKKKALHNNYGYILLIIYEICIYINSKYLYEHNINMLMLNILI